MQVKALKGNPGSSTPKQNLLRLQAGSGAGDVEVSLSKLHLPAGRIDDLSCELPRGLLRLLWTCREVKIH